jgi:hypothetical protein
MINLGPMLFGPFFDLKNPASIVKGGRSSVLKFFVKVKGGRPSVLKF